MFGYVYTCSSSSSNVEYENSIRMFCVYVMMTLYLTTNLINLAKRLLLKFQCHFTFPHTKAWN